MLTGFYELNPVLQALLATIFTWFLTAMGAVPVFFTTKINRKLFDAILGGAAGVMIAASFWSLLAPAIEMSGGSWIPAAVGFLAGAASLRLVDKILPHLHLWADMSEAEGISTTWRRSTLLVLAITLHNFPEGLAVGVAFGAAVYNLPGATVAGAIALTIGIGLQNIPEGTAVAMPLRSEGISKFKCFWYGQLSAVVEPVGGVLGAASVLLVQPLLPYALSFAAGAMIFVAVEELIPESQRGGNSDLATMGAIIGFAVMMVLDVALG